MNNTIFYFTGTGNSLKLAKDIAAKVDNSNIISMAKNMDKISEISPQGAVGFVFPIYYFGLPQLVKEFVSSVNLSNASYIYIVCSYGKTLGKGGCISQTRKILKSKGAALNSAFYIQCVDNFILWTWDVPAEKTHSKFHENARRKAEFAAEIIASKKNYFDKIITEKITPIIFGYKRFIGTVNTDDKAFNITDGCNSCGLCVKICPTNNMKMVDGLPVWKSKTCQRCLACLHLCPSACIQYGKITVKRRRYKNPYISVDELKRINY